MAQGGLKIVVTINETVLARHAPLGFPLHHRNAARRLSANRLDTSPNGVGISLFQRKFCLYAARNIGFHYPPSVSECSKVFTRRTPSSSCVTETRLLLTTRGGILFGARCPQQTAVFTSPATSQCSSYRLRLFGPFQPYSASFASSVENPNRTSGSKTCDAGRVDSSVWTDETGRISTLTAGAAHAPARTTPSLTAAAGNDHAEPVFARKSEVVTGDKCQEDGGEPCTASASVGPVDLVRENYATAVGAWLLGCCGMMFGMVCWGGYTRLTKSGLSMTDWRFRGTWLPTSEKSWEEQFIKYKETPEYRDVHYGISLEEFKEIYFIEWFHRMLGRATGGLFFGGLVFFAAARALSRRMLFRLTCLGMLGGAQGLVGWWMVKSGFSEPTTEVKTPRVSPYRLAAHLVAAMTLYSLTLWQALSVLFGPRTLAKSASALKAAGYSATAIALRKFQIRAAAVGALICTTLTSGAFVAGNDAGRVYNTWPKMHDHWVPPEVYDVSDNWQKIFENLAVVQFNHRMLAYASVAASALLYLTSRALPLPPQLKKALIFLPAATACQAVLGVATLLSFVPTELGVLHQAGGMTVLTVLLYLLQTASRLRFHL